MAGFRQNKETIEITEAICQDACMWCALNQVLCLRHDNATSSIPVFFIPLSTLIVKLFAILDSELSLFS